MGVLYQLQNLQATFGKRMICYLDKRWKGNPIYYWSTTLKEHLRRCILSCYVQNILQIPPTDMPPYFAFLTLMAFRVFLEEKVDVAIVEVGIGGERDCTNILPWVSYLLCVCMSGEADWISFIEVFWRVRRNMLTNYLILIFELFPEMCL